MAPLPVPPHVFTLREDRLRYARLPRANGGVDVAELQEVELGPEAIAEGTLGGTVRDASVVGGRLRELLAAVSSEVNEASLVLPDDWIRLAFAEVGELPRAARARDEVLRWKLRRLIPFRVEDLRLRARSVPPLANQEEPGRVLLAFAMESVLAQLEQLFAAAGVRLGQVSNASLALLEGVRATVEPLDLAAILYARQADYSLMFVHQGDPVIYRYKGAVAELPAEIRESQVVRDLKLTRKFVHDRLEGVRLRRVVLAAPTSTDAWWREQLGEVFGVPVTGFAELGGLAAAAGRPAPEDLAPMMGAACRSA